MRLRVPSVRLDVSNADADAVHLLLKKNVVPLIPLDGIRKMKRSILRNIYFSNHSTSASCLTRASFGIC